jgi:hypothetical protein
MWHIDAVLDWNSFEREKGIEEMYTIKLNNLLRHSINEIC